MKILLSVLLFVSFLFASVDINNANQKEFSSLKGVGDKKASDIIAFRKANGCFKSIDDLVKVKGIGKKTLEKNRENLTLGQCLN
ncbi:MAG TPA: helix-hairpin-helix domain-containing protein [Sulfurospirillum arcachonense]|nr:helix-hairpin-helix domain-containing protein [Sulfurospirillum arcachonense]HIP44892.1 helix-hairpin-helix domain-containing protein [Sulfurospirillum arcachonense]